MPVVRRIRNRGATLTVESHAEVLFMPTGDVGRWANRFTGRIRAKTIQAAPSNKRPRWAHYGKPLKSTIVSARPRFWSNGRDKQRVYAAVGSTASHALFPDQGTGVYAGNGPYRAKILPPWQHGSPSLYEATWRPGGPNGPLVRPVFIKGQRPQGFFDKGLAGAFHSMRMRSFQVPGDGGPRISEALSAIPAALEGFIGATPVSPAFIGQLNEWRAWRDEAWKKGEGIGRGGGVGSRAHERAVAAAKAKSRKSKQKPAAQAKPTKAQIAAQYLKAIQKERQALVAETKVKYAGRHVTVGPRRRHNGTYAYEVTVTANGRSISFWYPSDYQVAL